jgi:hypothetical protein
VVLFATLNIDNADIPLPPMQGVAEVQELFLAMELELVPSVRSGLPPEAVDLLAVYADEVVQIAVPAQNGSEHVVEWHSIGDRDQADDHRAHVA